MFLSTLLLLAESAPSTARLGAGSGPDLTRYFAVLGILLLAILGLAFGFKRLFSGAMRARSAQRQLAVIDLLPLGGKQRMAVVRCYDRTFALGLGEKEVSLIAEIDPVNVADQARATPSKADQASFARLLQRASGGETSSADPSAAREPSARETERAPTVGERVRRILGKDGVVG